MNFAVLHTTKGGKSSGGLGNHIDRVEGMEHTYQHADPNRKHLNHSFPVAGGREKMKLSEAIADRIEEGYKAKRKLRSDAVKFTTHILTGSHEKMKEIFEDKKKAEEWIKANYDFISKEFGKENIIRFNLHLDEKTPHIHAVTVPLTEDGRLSAKEIIGNKKAMQDRQDRYAEAMQSFGLERGIKNTGIKHENANQYYKRIEDTQNKSDFKASKNVLGIYTTESVRNLENALKTHKIALNDIEEKLNRERVKVQSLAKGSERLEKEKAILKQENNRIENTLEHYKQNPEQLVKAKMERMAREKERKEKEARSKFTKAINLAVNNAIIKTQKKQEELKMKDIIDEFNEVLKHNNLPNIWSSKKIENAIAKELIARMEIRQEEEQGHKRKFRR